MLFSSKMSGVVHNDIKNSLNDIAEKYKELQKLERVSLIP